ncbi:ABC transporter permease subunit [Butyrivibrio sp. INlla21]|uniref:ABC transporter permease subunit n=1 Tax=Butyrivibrio sp. INlla21 TaxID=1520811 RepID=UPI0008E6F504|nr:ABC transporter permease subunit [Butyrivibrio sp. INlla21]SFU54723.1 L-cystine transport system permease protein [Butyrivibrio sp. INlla21]
MSFSITSFFDSFKSALLYAPVTIKLTAITFIVSLLLGAVIATVRNYRVPVLSQFFAAFVTIYLGLPTMVALLLYNLLFMTFYSDVAAALHISVPISDVNPIFIGYITLIIGTTCSVSESIRGAFRGIEKVQYEAGYSIGMGKFKTLTRIIFPQMVPILLPGMQNSLIGLLKASNLVSAISVVEIMTGALLPSLMYYSYLEGYVAAALVYWMIGAAIEILAHFAEKNSGKYLKRTA